MSTLSLEWLSKATHTRATTFPLTVCSPVLAVHHGSRSSACLKAVCLRH